MENYTTLIFIVAIGCCFLDLLTDRWQAMQRQLFPLVTLVLYTLCMIAYYYGPDIHSYVPYYEDICHPSQLIAHPAAAKPFEFGYAMFCSLLHEIGLSYWWMTVVIKTIYFAALWFLLHRLPKRQIFALACIVMTDMNLIMHETRQCLAVSFFIFMVLLLQHRKYLWAAVCAALTITMHKSGFLPVSLTFLGIFFYQTRQYATIYILFILGLMALIALPVQRLSSAVVQLLPISGSYMESLSHHMGVGLQFQTIAIIYLALLVVFNLYLSYDHRLRYSWIAFMVLAGMGIIVLLYPYYFLLMRIRSYFAPFIIYYLVVLLSDSQRSQQVPYSSMIKQALMLLVIVYFSHVAISQERGARLLHSPVYRASTVFELRHASSGQIRNRQMKIAIDYWKNDYMQHVKGKL